MNTLTIRYRIKTATENEIFLHLIECSRSYVPPLATRVKIDEYAKKLFEKSITFEAWDEKRLVGVVAMYLNDRENIGFITNVSVLVDFVGHGIATNLMNMCFVHVRQIGIREILLEVNKQNENAIRFYDKFEFLISEIKDDTLLLMRVM